jgi:hypothetical protein
MSMHNFWSDIRGAVRLILPAAYCCFSMLAAPLHPATHDLTHSNIIIYSEATPRERQAARMLSEEIKKRTQVNWPITQAPISQDTPLVILVDRKQANTLIPKFHLASIKLPQALKPEGFSIRTLHHGQIILIVGSDERGVLFGAGYLLRHLDMSASKVIPHLLTDLDTAPAYPVRGHQLGYRPKNNTFDGWTAAQFEQYIRDLAVFGTNTIEIIPPRSDDDATSPLFTESPMQMMVKLSTILDRYGLDCSIWYPALDKDYSNPATIDAAVKEWGAIFDQLPRIDAVFVPGGDPGHTEPKYLFALLEQEAARLHVKHPKAQIWVSPQGFTASWLDEFYGLLTQHPTWLTGVVYGPEMRDSLEEFRRKVPAGIPIRFYPDITHTLGAQYPVPLWDPAFALTEGREPVNPRPVDENILFHRFIPFTNGFVAYSEGSNDDVNKVLWSSWGWNPQTTANTGLNEYARYFISPQTAPQVATAIQALETNWRGPLLSNASVDDTLALLKSIEQKEASQVENNWRLQQLLYRGYYDAYVQERLKRETSKQRTAVLLLKQDPLTDAVLDAAEKALPEAAVCGDDAECSRAEQLADDLFQTIRMQLSVQKYKALAVSRGANLDQITNPLTSAKWLQLAIEKAKATTSLEERAGIVHDALVAIGETPSLAYDDLGNIARQPHLVPTKSFEQDPYGLERTYLGVETSTRAEKLALPLRTFAATLYDRPLEMQYQELPSHDLIARIDMLSDARKLTVKANETLITPTCDEDHWCIHPTYAIAASLVQHGKLHLVIAVEPGLGHNGRSMEVTAIHITSNK